MHCCCCFSRHRTTVFMWCEFGMFSTLLVAMASLDTHQVVFSEHKLTTKKQKNLGLKLGVLRLMILHSELEVITIMSWNDYDSTDWKFKQNSTKCSESCRGSYFIPLTLCD